MNTWKAPEDVVAAVVLIDGCLSTCKGIRGYYDKDHKEQIKEMIAEMGGKYFNRQPGRIIVVGKLFRHEWKEAKEWFRSFKAHPDEKQMFYQDIYCTNQQEWNDIYDGKFKIPVGEKTKEDYVPKNGEIVIVDPAWGAYQAPEMR